ncbi:hypothetical protein K431DRAFT_260837 [Polychaeton citri CBS 116435]|uniref:Chromatin assembly factor 1 subunit A n=1 Tax=Polychaeton citri CBS 116435 TaxID=1314669 RepID=A0A9P4QI71_9PEZI|nr:hypothetical protein K431DRAFT_260837 [Polychaeton citri CBS 116435]
MGPDTPGSTLGLDLSLMDDIISSPPSPGVRKRPLEDTHSGSQKLLNLKGNQFMMPTPPDTDNSSNASPSEHQGQEETRAASPAPSSSALSSIDTVTPYDAEDISVTANSTTRETDAAHASNTTNEPPRKRRKLTQAEKEEHKRQRETKEHEKAEQKARREEEKRAKEEEKREERRVKDEERRRKAEEKEGKRREKEIEEEKKQQEKLKKERNQMRLGAFFQKPATPIKQSASAGNDTTEEPWSMSRRRSLSLETYDNIAEKLHRSASPCKGMPNLSKSAAEAIIPQEQSKHAVSDYKRFFLPFEPPSHTYLAAIRVEQQDPEEAQIRFDHDLHDESLREKFNLGIEGTYACLGQRFAQAWAPEEAPSLLNVRELMDRIHGSSHKPIDLTGDASVEQSLELLRQIPVRYLHFWEDIRPPYFGTYSKLRSSGRALKLCRNPFTKAREDTDYDNDSEAEWQEPEEGEDILDDEDDEAESLGDAEEMDDFLDDEHDELKNKRKMISGDLEPVSTGLCWEDGNGRLPSNAEGGNLKPDLRGMQMDVLLPNLRGKAIDPFATIYWETEQVQIPVSQALASNGWPIGASLGVMPPPSRPPLQQLPSGNRVATQVQLIGASEGEKGPITSTSAANTQPKKAGRKPAPKSLSEGEIAEFKDAVVGSQLGKADLCKGLKLRFKKMTNEIIKETLSTHFAQVGSTKADKKWIFVGVT